MKKLKKTEENYYYFIKQLFSKSRLIIMPYFGKTVEVANKADMSPVTIADQNTEQALRKMIIQKYPDHGIIGEEFDPYKANSDYIWTLDPIDGTKSFIAGVPLFGTMISLLQNGKPVLGAINFPALNITVFGNSKVCLINDNPSKMRSVTNLSKATVLTTDHFDNTSAKSSENFQKLIKSVNIYRTWGDCYGYYLLAAGFADIMLDPKMEQPWDKMPIIPIINGAGGTISDNNGNSPENGSGIIAAHPHIHSAVIKALHS